MNDHSDLAQSSSRDAAKVALDLVSEAQKAIKHIEYQTAERVARAESFANDATEKMQLAEARAERAETDLAYLRDLIAKIKDASEQALLRCATKELELTATKRRAAIPENRASGAEAATDPKNTRVLPAREGWITELLARASRDEDALAASQLPNFR